MWYVWVMAALALAVVALGLYLLSLRGALKEVAQELADKLQTDTNTLISLSSGDRAVRALAAQMNTQLQVLRQERLKLQHGDAERKAAITNVSHDLRTPLTAICGYIDLLEQEPLPERPRRYLKILRERTETMRTLTEELLRYCVSTAAEEELTPVPLDLRAVLEQSLAGLYGTLTRRSIQPRIELPEGPVSRDLDPAALRRIYDNILSNAAKYSAGDLTVRLGPDGTALFENSAGSLDPVQVQRLFDRYFTVQSASGSTGLGLSIARQLTQRMGGSIRADFRDGRLCVSVRFPA